MTKQIEARAKRYLVEEFKSSEISFSPSGQNGFDLWIHRKNAAPIKGELKATDGTFTRPSDVSVNMIFNTEEETILFKGGDTMIVRVFLGDEPPTVILINKAFLGANATFKHDERYILEGKKNYGANALQMLQRGRKKH